MRGGGGRTRAAGIDATRHKLSLQQCRLKEENVTENTWKSDALPGAVFVCCSYLLHIRGGKSVEVKEKGGGGKTGLMEIQCLFFHPKVLRAERLNSPLMPPPAVAVESQPSVECPVN